ncbi:cytochrome c biogenesis protein CcsA [Flavobacterium jejuense]|uniref:Cytochrome c biogenesis protein CcsA n=1 Tax=Flavobacterium jejuense TaxID=1544455 RepID=A0ABX0IQ10_9FLAO|nr:cytochrome c biogenesis protein CcsA [Flavobacterium jejuense]NHN25165.1 cytochrome c biogenesis protein CcsA [Flavobacterium jejuense]
MDKKIFSFLFSTRLMAVLFIVFAAAMGIGTFIEDAYNTETARIIIYNAWWFEVIMVFFVINFIGNIKRYQLYKREKWATLLIHLSFIFILVGAFITRYISYEGMMLIQEGQTENRIFSDKTYVYGFVDGEHEGEIKRRSFEKSNYFAPEKIAWFLKPFFSNDFTIKGEFNAIPYKIEYDRFIMNASETIEADTNGIQYLKMVESSDGSRHEHFLKEGQVQNIHNILYAFNVKTEGAINISSHEGKMTIQTPFEGNFMRMADQMQGKVTKDSTQSLQLRSLYNIAGNQFVFPEVPVKGKIIYKSNNDYRDKQTPDAVVVTIKSQGKEEKVTLVGSKGMQGTPQMIKIGDLDFTLFFGSKVYETPFNVKLDDFIADKYPGTEKSYSAFKSKIEIIDTEKNNTFKDSIYMNNVLDYRGFRFFQAGFDPDEKGTHLSVNHDQWGTWITYIGYFLLYFALMAILFDKNTRFGDLKKKINKINEKKNTLASLFLLFFSFLGFSQEHTNHNNQIVDSNKALELISKYKVSEEHASEFGKTVIQDQGGRTKPINTFSSELLRKVSKSETYNDMNADQAFISMTQFPQYWYTVPIIYLKRGNDSIRKIAGIDSKAKYASLVDFFDAKGNYKLAPYLDEAYREAVPNSFQKDFIEADKKVNLLYDALSGKILRVYPIPNDKGNKWVSYLEISDTTRTVLDTVKNIIPFYLDAVSKASQNKDYKLANSLLIGLKEYQKKYGKNVMISDQKIATEILYNKYDIFKRLFYLYMLAAIFMLGFAVYQLFSKAKWVNYTVNFFHVLILLFFTLHTLGLIARWYVSGHAPWSNAYESMIYVAWATMLFTLLLGFPYPIWFLLFTNRKLKKSAITIAAGAFVTSMLLMVAHWSWLDPEIGNLQPVLNSYWLMIHVAVIVASYGPFALGMILGLIALFLMIFTNSNNVKKVKLAIDELSYINEMAITVGLVMLTIGNFLGGQWANESWGRYWGWDPKETWALISIFVYAFVIHARLVPGLRGKWFYNFASVLAFASIVMTYVGVNFHLSGLHSYASGEKQNVTYYLYILAGVVTIGIFALVKYNIHFSKKK